MPLYKFKCDVCSWKCTKDTDSPALVRCKPCNRQGVAHTMSYRKKRSTAFRRDKDLDADRSLIHTRAVRAVKPTAKMQDLQEARGKKRQRDDDDDLPAAKKFRAGGDSDEDDEESAEDDGALGLTVDDAEFLPTPDFNPSMRYSAGGSFLVARIYPGLTSMKSKPWTRITAAAGRASTAAQFGGQSAGQHFQAYPALVPAVHFLPSRTGVYYEWCHLIADSLGGPTTADNLFCGSVHANTAMLCIESVIRGAGHLEVKVDVVLIQGTHIGLTVTYSVRDTARARPDYVRVLDGLATGCTANDARDLIGEVRRWLNG